MTILAILAAISLLLLAGILRAASRASRMEERMTRRETEDAAVRWLYGNGPPPPWDEKPDRQMVPFWFAFVMGLLIFGSCSILSIRELPL